MKNLVPLSILKLIDVSKDPELLDILTVVKVGPKYNYLHFTDKSGAMYFKIKSEVASNPELQRIVRRPRSESNPHEVDEWVLAKDVPALFSAWLKIVREVSKLQTPFDDPVFESYKSYYAEKIGELKNPNQPLYPDEQFKFLEYLDFVEQALAEFEQKQNSQSEEIASLREEIQFLKQNLSKLPKKDVKDRWTTILTKGIMLSVEFAKQITIDIASDNVTKYLGI
jgi:hypothetical protein